MKSTSGETVMQFSIIFIGYEFDDSLYSNEGGKEKLFDVRAKLILD